MQLITITTLDHRYTNRIKNYDMKFHHERYRVTYTMPTKQNISQVATPHENHRTRNPMGILSQVHFNVLQICNGRNSCEEIQRFYSDLGVSTY